MLWYKRRIPGPHISPHRLRGWLREEIQTECETDPVRSVRKTSIGHTTPVREVNVTKPAHIRLQTTSHRHPKLGLRSVLEQVLRTPRCRSHALQRREARAEIATPSEDFDIVVSCADLDPVAAREALPQWIASWASDDALPPPRPRRRGRPCHAVTAMKKIRIAAPIEVVDDPEPAEI